jgi:hypothetical protein
MAPLFFFPTQCTSGAWCDEPLTCDHGVCDPLTGGDECDCAENWMGVLCDQCIPCRSGANCEVTCSNHGAWRVLQRAAPRPAPPAFMMLRFGCVLSLLQACAFSGAATVMRATVATCASKSARPVLAVPCATSPTPTAVVRDQGLLSLLAGCSYACSGVGLDVCLRFFSCGCVRWAGHGVCNAAKGCECTSGWTGLFCEDVAPPSHSKGKAGAVAGGVIAALAVVGIAGVCYVYRCVGGVAQSVVTAGV